MTPAPRGLVGRPLRRQEDPRLLRGNGAYVGDLALPGLLHLAVLRSPHAHARLVDTDLALAAKSPGVLAVVRAADLGGVGPLPVLTHPPGQRQTEFPVLPADRVVYAGQPVAAVVAESRYAAQDALDLMRVTYDPLPALTDVIQATAPGAPRLYAAWPDNVAVAREIGPGIPEGLFASAPVVVEATFTMPRQTAAPLEGRATCAAYDAGAGVLTVWASSQAPHQYRTVLAGALGLDEERIRVIVPDVGGGFGVKLHYYPEELLACVAAMRLGRPVRWVEDRSEHFVATVHAREQTTRARAAFDARGTLLGLDVHVRGDVGAHLHTKGAGPIFLGGAVLPGQYAVRHFRARLEGVVTNKVPAGAYRAFGMQQAAFVIERLLDVAAARLGLDPAEIRHRNYPPPGAFPFRNAAGMVYDSGDYRATLERALEVADYAGLRAMQARERARGRLVGVGLAGYVEVTGMGPSRLMAAMGNRQGGYETAVVRLDPSGGATVFTGIIEIGQGIRTSLAQVAAEALTLPHDRVRVVLGDTDVCRVRGVPARAVTLAEVAREAQRGQNLPPGMDPGLDARFTYQPENWTHPYGVHVVAVEVSRELGTVDLLGYWVAHDCGTLLNPLLVDGQLAGGVAQGIGGALLERLVYDDTGQPLCRTFMEYALPTAAAIPPLVIAHLETPSPHTPGGMKGMAEGGTIAAPAAVANAVADALAGAGVDPAAIDFYPLTPARIFALLDAMNPGIKITRPSA